MATYVLRRKVFAAVDAATNSALPVHVPATSNTKQSLIQKGKKAIVEQATRAKKFYNRQGKLGKAGIIAGTIAVPVTAVASGVALKKRAARKAEAEQVEYSDKISAKKVYKTRPAEQQMLESYGRRIGAGLGAALGTLSGHKSTKLLKSAGFVNKKGAALKTVRSAVGTGLSGMALGHLTGKGISKISRKAEAEQD